MRLPKKITICGHEITIRYKRGLVVNGQACWGVYDDKNREIVLRMGMDKSRKAEIFLHECIHAIECIHVLDLSEKAVKILGIEIIALIKNNRIKL